MRKPLLFVAVIFLGMICLGVICLGMIATMLATVSQAQQLTVQPEAGAQKVLTRADIETLPHIKVATAIHGTPATFEGVALQSVLEKAGVRFGESLRGARMASCLLVEAADGYRVVIALPEIDPAFTNQQILLAFSKDGKPLDDKEGPYRIVIPDEKRPARWARQVTALKIVDVK
ncbi:MAG: molybdopterin-dependent oxidoreductase [Candidatus Sulfotelmatobacter sp.]